MGSMRPISFKDWVRSGYGNLFGEINVLNGVKEFGSLVDRALERFTSRNEASATSTLVDHRSEDRLFKVFFSAGTTAIDKASSAHVAVGNLIAAEVDRMISGEFGVDALVEFAVARTTCVKGFVSSVVLRKLLLDDVCLDGAPKVVL
jgi:hypothetical protein